MHIRSILMGAAASALVASAAFAERGSDGQVNILYWQAVSIMNPYLSNGTKDVEAGSLVLEPLARFNENGDMVPYLAAGDPHAGERRRLRGPDDASPGSSRTGSSGRTARR